MSAGRRREAAGREGPRPLDLDLLLYGDETLDMPGLVVPHPRMAQRRFVLVPLSDILPARVVPGLGRTVSELLSGGAAVPRRAMARTEGRGRRGPMAVTAIPGSRPRSPGAVGRLVVPALLAGLAAGGGAWAIAYRDAVRIAADRTDRTAGRTAEAIVQLVAERLVATRLLAGDPLLAATAQRLDGAGSRPGSAAGRVPPDTQLSESRFAPTHLVEPDGPASLRLRQAVAALPGATAVLLTDSAGTCVAGSEAVHQAWVGATSWWKDAAASGFDVSLPEDGREIPVDTFAVSVRVGGGGAGASPIGVVRVLFRLDVLRRALLSAEPISPMLVTRDRQFLRAEAESLAPLESDASLAGIGPLLSSGAAGSTGRLKLVPVTIGGRPGRLWIAVRPLAPALPRPSSVALFALGGSFVAALAALWGSRGARREMAGGLVALAAYVRRTGEGGRTVPPPQTANPPELADLGRALTDTFEPLRSARVEQEASRRSLEERLNARGVELARASQELQRRTEELAAASRGKEEFVRVITHELRTPLNSVIGLTQLVRDGAADSPEEARSFLDQVLASARDLLKIVNDVLEVTQLESGRVELELTEVDVRRIVEEVRRASARAAQERKLSFHLSVDPDLPTAWADGPRLQQVLASLVDNALKFTESGGVLLRVRPSDGRRKVLFEVEDTGVGIPDERRSQVFEKFIQGETGAARRFGGTGLGLPIARLLVEAMGGRIGLEPGAGGIGTRAWFTVPTPGREGR